MNGRMFHIGLAIAILSLAGPSAVHAESAYKLADGKVKNSHGKGSTRSLSREDCQQQPCCESAPSAEWRSAAYLLCGHLRARRWRIDRAVAAGQRIEEVD